jgi:hypothetical protein
MMQKEHQEVLKSLTEIFADRVKRPPLQNGAGAEEARRLAEVAAYIRALLPRG